MSIKLGERKDRTPISYFSPAELRYMASSNNTPAKTKQKIRNYLTTLA